jgi:hypothetical protein
VGTGSTLFSAVFCLRGLMQTDDSYLKYGIFRLMLFEGADADRKNPPPNSVEAVPAESQKE